MAMLDPAQRFCLPMACARLRRFTKNDSGAVTTDWVVLTAAIVGMAITFVGATLTGVVSLGDNVSSSLSDAEVVALNGLDGAAGEENAEVTPGSAGAGPAVAEEDTREADDPGEPIRVINRGGGRFALDENGQPRGLR
jgi:hypothetical protein